MRLSVRSRRIAVIAGLGALLVAACGDGRNDVSEAPPALECGTPRLASASAAPFEWVEVVGIPEGLGPAMAKVRADAVDADGETPGDVGSSLTFVRAREDGSIAVQAPIHPSFRRSGGDVTLRIYTARTSCDPVSLTVEGLEPAPGAMAEATVELRAAVDELLAPLGLSDMDADAVPDLLAASRDLPVLSIPALWVLPEVERLESLLAEDAVRMTSPEDAEMLDAIAGRLELADRMRGFRDLVSGLRELTGELRLAAPRVAPRASSSSPGAESPFHFAAATHDPTEASDWSPAAGPRRRIPPVGRPSSSCPEGRENLFAIDEAAKLDNLMRAQDYAERFVAGASGEEGGSASGTVFNDIGAVVGWLEYAGKAGKAAAAVWDAFSTVVLNTAEAYEGLLPGEMELTVTADPPRFDEDSQETGRWTASATATSDGMKLTQKVIDKVMETALEKGLADASIGEELVDVSGADSKLGEKLRRGAADEIDEQLIKQPTSDALDALLESIGAKEVEGGFDIPGGCWTLDDMSSGAPQPADDEEGVREEGGAPGSSPPPLVTGYLTGGTVEFVEAGNGAPREYEPVEAGTSRLEIRTAEGYRKTVATGAGHSIGTTYAFGGDQYTAVTRISVDAIEVQINPSIIRVEPGDRVPFVATVRNAEDTRVRWTSSANPLDEIVDFGDGTHEAVLIAPENPELYPVSIEIESVARGGARADGLPVRKATARVHLADPIIDIRPATACLSEGDRKTFEAVVYGVENQEVRWSDSGGPGRIDQGGVFRARGGEGTVTITAAWAEDPDVTASVDVEVGACEATWSARVNGGPGGGDYSGADARATLRDGGVVTIGLHDRDASGCPMIGFSLDAPISVIGSRPAEGFVAFTFCEGDFGNASGGSPYELSNGTGAPFHPPRGTLTLREISEDWVVGEYHGQMFEAANGDERNNYDVRYGVSAQFRARVQ